MSLLVLLCSSYFVFSSNSLGLFPAILNLASNAEITTNATCGDPLPEMYCKLVEHVPGRRIRNPQCRSCDANSANPKERHPITNAIDGTNQWWQSPSIKNGRQFHWVTITLDLRQVFQVAYVIIKAANSPRPGNWILERSLDGINFHPWQYYAISDTECLTRYNITPRIGPPTYKRDEEVICTSYYSRLVPLEHGEIHTSLINGRPGADDLTPELLEFTSARFIRLRLQRIRTLNADLMTLSYRDPKDVDPIVTRRYYYSLKDISVGGMCICYGHAQSCPLDPVTKKLQCVCEHNTCGESCNECCPGYHQELWQPGTISDGNTCEKCNCHNKAEDCYYNQTVADLKMSMNTHGQFVGGGVCINCTQNTAGVNCETCADGYYRPHKVSPYANEPCLECNCDIRGSVSHICVRDDNHANPGLLPGQCLCKEGFAGERCDRCAFGYRDFPLCTHCECSLEGSHNIDPCTECICKANVMGANCDLCKQGFYNLQASNPEGCTECFCFGVSDVCESSTWNTSLVRYHTHTHPESSSVCSVICSAMCCYLTAYGSFLNYSVAYDVSVDSNVDKALPSHFDVVVQGNGRTMRQQQSRSVLLNPHREQQVVLEILPRLFVDVHTERRVQRDELMSVLADVASLRIRAHLNSSVDGVLRLSSVSLAVADPTSRSSTPAPDVEQCECPWGYSGTSCEYCISGFYRVGGILFGGNCLQCECNEHATECDIDGVCLSCSHNTTGPHCDQCLPGYYGDPTEGTAEDCQRCACPLTLASNNFSPTCSLQGPGEVMCDQCEQGYTGAKCERCANGYYGNPTVPGQKCSVCECNGNVDTSEPGHCDSVTGECLKCVQHTSGRHCERCEDGYYGDAVTAKNCQGRSINEFVFHYQFLLSVGFHGINSGDGCRSCECNQSGSVSEACAEDGQCQCIVGVSGDKCDRCQHGYYNFTNNGCTPCDCAHTHGNCNAETGECICPPHTRGEKCEMCEDDHWGHDGVTGCKPCNCSAAGSNSSQCDLLSGQCACRLQFTGQKCDRCALGFRNFPECTACNCNTNGTREDFCNDGLGVCGCEDHGVCVCKDNVGGGGCDECKSGTFGLWGQNPAGCSPCFCFGVSSVCEELGGLVRVPITVGREAEHLHVVSQSDLQGTLEGVYNTDGEVLLDVAQLQSASTLAGPYYWRLPQRFQGSKLLSYGGELSYSVVFAALDGSGLSNYEPQILMRGGHLRKLVIYTDMPAPEHGIRTTQRVSLAEHKWKYFNAVSEKAVSHADFMSVLSNVEYIIIKASYGTGLQQSRISNISMETAVEADEAPEGTQVARLVEACECPPGYAGLSCQECAPGYYRQSVSELNMKGRNRPLIQPCVPCQCNNHSLACDLDTGKCLGCQHNTAGEHCNVCAPGYYGRVKGSISDCSICACPLQSNSFSPTCVLEGVGDFHCNACKPGYEGRYCERCALGYYGNPSEPGGKCEVCQCSETGSLHSICDAQTGKCMCKAGVRGHLCDQCDNRYVLSDDQCVSCDDECTGVLLDDVDAIEALFQSLNLSGVILAPYSLLISLENQTQELQVCACSDSSLKQNTTYQLGNKRERAVTNLSQQVDELDALALLESIQKEMVEPSNRMETLKENISTALNRHNQQLQEARELLNTAKSHNNHTEHLLKNIHTNIEEFTVRNSLGLCCFDNLETHMEDAQDLLTDRLEETKDELLQWSPTLRKHVDSLVMELTKTDALQLVYRAEDHAQALKKEAQAVYRFVTLSGVREASQNVTSASQVNSDITTNIQQAEELALIANQNASSFKVLTGFLINSMSKSFCVLSRIYFTVVLGNWKTAYRTTKVLFTDICCLYSNVLSASAAESKLKEAQLRTERLFDRLKPLKTLGENLSRNLSEIKELINQARKQAASIKVAVSADRDCVRAYKPEVTSSNFNTLTLTVKTTEPGNLLFYMGSSSSVDFMALEMRHGKVSFLWDAGSGHAKLEYPDVQINNNKWHRINATRFGKQGSLTVQQLDSEPMPTVKTTAPGSATVMEVSKSTWVFVGGLGGQVKKSPAVKMSHFKGCMGEASLNEKNIGLWNYAEREGGCGGCFMRPLMEETSFYFDGSGYSVVEKSLRSISTSVVMFFKTLSPNGLLLYLASNGTRDFLSIELVEGRVHLTFELGSGPLTLTSTKTYNTGTWYKIALQRNKRKGYLAVMVADNPSEREVMEAESPGTASDLNRSDLDPIYIGGLPASRPIRYCRQVVARSYVGCIKNVEIARTNFDLLKESYGVKKGCILKPIRSVSVLGGGYIQMPAVTVGPQTEIISSFSSRNSSGLILAGLNSPSGRKRRHTQQSFLVVVLASGRVEVHVSMAEGGGVHKAVIKSRNGTFSDGQEHSLILQRNKRTLTVYVDEEQQETVRLGSGAEKVFTLSNFYIGGVPAGETTALLASTTSFYGCIRNLAVDNMLLDLSSAVRYERVDMDSCLLEERPRRILLPDEGNVEAEPTADPSQPKVSWEPKCALTPQYICILDCRYFSILTGPMFSFCFLSSFTVELSIRTLATSGILFYMANANQQDYAVLQLQGGRLLFSCDLGKGPAITTSRTQISDGQWHTVRTDFSKKSTLISVDGVDSERTPIKGHTLDVEGKLYLGGLPKGYIAKRIGNVTHSMAGCMQKIKLNSAELSLQNAASSHQTDTCFSSVQEGSFFNGSGYATFMKEGYYVGSDVTVSLEFRSTALDGVLLGVSSTRVDAIGLELLNGQVVFNVNNGAGRFSAVSRSRGLLCDGRWHTLVAKKLKHSLSLTVDGLTVSTENPHSSSTSAETKNPIYVGGYPADVKQSCLSSRTSFRGCMRNLRFSKGHITDVLDFASAFARPGVSPHSCPAAPAAP
uniref:Basement membrane-specific heparan sulfate proteoglycan core protein n=1 Tax=Pygocentrus nattereri TaxID=42514 RepID=A0AAR2L104_PYGNA